jgi:hypothetical protein
MASYSNGKHGLRMFKNRVLRRIFRLERKEVTGGWIKLHSEAFCSTDFIRIM